MLELRINAYSCFPSKNCYPCFSKTQNLSSPPLFHPFFCRFQCLPISTLLLSLSSLGSPVSLSSSFFWRGSGKKLTSSYSHFLALYTASYCYNNIGKWCLMHKIIVWLSCQPLEPSSSPAGNKACTGSDIEQILSTFLLGLVVCLQNCTYKFKSVSKSKA